jgi:release factor glutamine methyltransferase
MAETAPAAPLSEPSLTATETAATVRALVGEAAAAFDAAGLEQPRAEARWLVAQLLSLTDSALLAHPDALVAPADAVRVLLAIQRRAAHEPFAYVVGEREFYGRSFVVDRRVLVPRPETETLIDEAVAILKHQQRSGSASPLVVDVGTGSGAIACTLALEAPFARVVACDLSADALTVAAQNRARLGLSGRLALVRGSLLSWLRAPAELIVANLPYIPAARIQTLMPEVAEWEPRLALDGGPDGLDLVRVLLANATRTMRSGGTILLELDPEQMTPAAALLPDAASRVIPDLAGLGRVLRLDLP